ncbi:hypothetical protein SRB5_55190 [Streptomyces sp. RB5]|uniref:Uncharacterized protein n=1 Tax=Streptomyces smaragdinus TaxID=2585196 RepID=A0A7K0CPC1_9ACTN|nr:hypothetical protein [Streptomyces smaragdinus]
MAVGDLADRGGEGAVHGQFGAASFGDLDEAVGGASGPGEVRGEAGGLGGADEDAAAQPGRGELRPVLVGVQPSRVQGEHAVGEPGSDAGVGERGEDGDPVVGEVAEHAVEPGDFAGGEVAYGIVQDEGVRVTDQGGGEAEAAVRAEGEGVEAVAGQAVEAGQVQDVVGVAGGNADGGGKHPQMVADGAGGVARGVAEEDADLAAGERDGVERPAVEEGDAAAGLAPEHQAQRGGLSGAPVAEQRGEAARVGLEGEVVDRSRTVSGGPAGQSDGLDHSHAPRYGMPTRYRDERGVTWYDALLRHGVRRRIPDGPGGRAS